MSDQATGFTKPASRFIGWSASENGPVNPAYEAGKTIAVNTSITLYAQWETAASPASLTVSNKVAGEYGDRNKAYDFTIYFFKDAAGSELLDIVASFPTVDSLGNPGDTLTLKNGRVNFQLKHGQGITILDIPDGCWIDIRETDVMSTAYKVTCQSGNAPVGISHAGNIAKLQALQKISGEQAFHFTNERLFIPTTDIALGDTEAMIPLIAQAFLAMIVLTAIVVFHWRKRKNAKRFSP